MVARDPTDLDSRDRLARLLNQHATIGTSTETGVSNSRRSNEIWMALLQENPLGRRRWRIGSRILPPTSTTSVTWCTTGRTVTAAREKRLDLLHESIDAFQKGRDFCEKRVKPADRRDRVLRSLALNARYLCRRLSHAGQLFCE